MVRRPTLASKTDDAKFRVRVKFSTPGSGIKGLTHIHRWLKGKFGEGGYAVHPERWDGHMYAIAVYFNDAATAPEVARYVEDVIGERVSFDLGEWNPSGPGFHSYVTEAMKEPGRE